MPLPESERRARLQTLRAELTALGSGEFDPAAMWRAWTTVAEVDPAGEAVVALRAALRSAGEVRPAATRRALLRQVTLCCVDCRDPDLGALAMQNSLRQCEFGGARLFTSDPARYPGIDTVAIAPIRSLAEYSRFMVKELGRHVDTEYALVVQWDGYVINASAWDDAFLLFDYIAPRWNGYDDGMVIGTGGFSLRTAALHEALRDPAISICHPEDIVIGRGYRRMLEDRHDIAYPPDAVADAFAFETVGDARRAFGFHSHYNVARFVDDPAVHRLAFLRPLVERWLDESLPAGNGVYARSIQDNTAEGLRRFDEGDYAGAEERFRAALAEAPDDAAILLNLASALCAQGRLKEAAAPARAAYRQDPLNANFRECLKFIALNLGNDGAFALAQGDERDPMALIGLGNSRRENGDLAAAEQAYSHALAIAPDDPFVNNRLGALRCCQQRYAESAPYFRLSARAGLLPDQVIDFSPAFLDGLIAQGGSWSGSLPAVEFAPPSRRRDIVLFLSCDSGYFEKFAFALVHSVHRNAGVDCAMHFHVVNPDERFRLAHERIVARFPDVDVRISRETIEVADPGAAKTYYACSRFLRLPEAMRAYSCPVAIIDLDLLVMRGLEPLLRGIRGCDVAVPQGAEGRCEPGETLWASFVYFAATPAAAKAAEFIGAYVSHYLESGKPIWFLEQIALLACYAQAGPLAVKFRMLPLRTINCSDAPETIAVPQADGGGYFWTNANSIPAHAARLDAPGFREFAADPPLPGA